MFAWTFGSIFSYPIWTRIKYENETCGMDWYDESHNQTQYHQECVKTVDEILNRTAVHPNSTSEGWNYSFDFSN